MKIGIFYLGIGAYSVMWEGFYNSAKKYFFPNESKDFFYFSDKPLPKPLSDVTYFHVENLGWPGNTLYRFKYFLMVGEKMKDYDYCCFFNANASFVKNVPYDIFPTGDCHISSVGHFKYLTMNKVLVGYDRNKKSTAYVPWHKEPENSYCQACIIIATGSEMLSMSKELSQNIDIDDSNGVCAKWHDESHFNHYLINHSVKVLSLDYAYPEALKLKGYNPYIVMRDKNSFADLNVLRNGKKRSFMDFLKFKFGNFKTKFIARWHLIFK